MDRDVVVAARARTLAPKLRALGDEHRLTFVLLLAQRARTVKELQEATGLSQTLASHHLKVLREQGVISATARGRANVYTLCCDALGDPLRLLVELAANDPAAA